MNTYTVCHKGIVENIEAESAEAAYKELLRRIAKRDLMAARYAAAFRRDNASVGYAHACEFGFRG